MPVIQKCCLVERIKSLLKVTTGWAVIIQLQIVSGDIYRGSGISSTEETLKALRMQALRFTLCSKTGSYLIGNRKTKWNLELCEHSASTERPLFTSWDVQVPSWRDEKARLQTEMTVHSSGSITWYLSTQTPNLCCILSPCIVCLKPILLLDLDHTDEGKLQLAAVPF